MEKTKLRLVLVDDEAELVFTRTERLELRGYDVDAVTSGAEALEKIKLRTYDVAVIDVKMPVMSGDDVLREAKRICPELSTTSTTS